MKSRRLFACVAGSAMLIVAFYVYEEYVALLGFPDNGITELGFAERKLAVIFAGFSVLPGTYLIYLGTLALHPPAGRRLSVPIVAYLAALIAAVLVDQHYCSILMGGGGG